VGYLNFHFSENDISSLMNVAAVLLVPKQHLK